MRREPCPECGNRYRHDKNCPHRHVGLLDTKYFLREPRSAAERARMMSVDFPGSDYSADETEWLRAISNWQTCHGRLTGPKDRRLLQIAKHLGYQKVTDAPDSSPVASGREPDKQGGQRNGQPLVCPAPARDMEAV